MTLNLRGIGLAGLGMVALLGLGAGGAAAAPQALALVSSDGDVTLACSNGECAAEMSAFCLQQDRVTPRRGTKYNLVDGSDLILKGVTADGRELVLDAAKYVRFQSERTHVAVRVAVSAEEMAALGIDRVKLNVGVNVALVPDPASEDDRSQLESDLMVLTGSMRHLGSRIVDYNRKHMVAARLTSRMINEIPAGSRLTAAQGEQLWQSTIDGMQDRQLPAEGVGLARRAVDFCKFAIDTRVRLDMRKCLQSEHDDLIGILNSNYWQAVKTGS